MQVASQRLSNAQIQTSAHQFARWLDAADIPRRGVVATLLPNIPEFLYVLRGTTWSGRTFTPINWHLSATDIQYILDNSEACAIVLHRDFIAHLPIITKTINPNACLVIDSASTSDIRLSDFDNTLLRFSDATLNEAVAGTIMMYTSGTTGRPKGVTPAKTSREPPPCFTSKMGSMMLANALPNNANGAHLVAAPLYHAAPSTYGEGAALLGADLVIMQHWNAEGFLQLVESEQIVSTFLVPTQIIRLLQLPNAVKQRYDLSSLQLICHGAAPISQAIKTRAIEWLGPILFEFYGGTEGGGVSINAHDWLAHPGSVGKPRPGLNIHILDNNGKPCETGTAGDVYFSTDDGSGFSYKNDPEKTANSYRDNQYTLGDIGYLDQDDYLYLCDRKADTIISGGVNIYPAQIESVLLENAKVLDCCVVGIEDDEWGEYVLAVVQLKQPANDNNDIYNELIALCQQSLARFQQPRELVFSDSLPRTEAGKLLRREVRDYYRTLLTSAKHSSTLSENVNQKN